MNIAYILRLTWIVIICKHHNIELERTVLCNIIIAFALAPFSKFFVPVFVIVMKRLGIINIFIWWNACCLVIFQFNVIIIHNKLQIFTAAFHLIHFSVNCHLKRFFPSIFSINYLKILLAAAVYNRLNQNGIFVIIFKIRFIGSDKWIV